MEEMLNNILLQSNIDFIIFWSLKLSKMCKNREHVKKIKTLFGNGLKIILKICRSKSLKIN